MSGALVAGQPLYLPPRATGLWSGCLYGNMLWPPRGQMRICQIRRLKSVNSRVGTRLERTGMYKHILISTDGSEVARKGVDHGLSLAKDLGARVTIITVTERFPVPVHLGIAGGHIPGPSEM